MWQARNLDFKSSEHWRSMRVTSEVGMVILHSQHEKGEGKMLRLEDVWFHVSKIADQLRAEVLEKLQIASDVDIY